MITYPFRFCVNNIKRMFNIPSEPFLLNYSVTFRCNLDCKYCGVSRLKNNYSQEELSRREISIFLDDKKLRYLDVVVVTGGEPFLKDDLAEIILEFKKKSPVKIFHITTNGFLTERIVDSMRFFRSKGLKIDLKISIDDIGDRHDALRGKAGSFQKAVLTLSSLRKIMKKNDIFIGINQTIYEENSKSIPEVKKLAHEFDVSYLGFIGLKMRPLYSSSGECDYALTDLSEESRDIARDELSNNYPGKIKLNNFSDCLEKIIIQHYTKGQLDLLYNKHKRHRCMNLFSHFRLNPNGDILTCSYDTEVLGNIKKESYSRILKKEFTKEKLNKVKGCGRCWLGCEVTPSWVSSLCLA